MQISQISLVSGIVHMYLTCAKRFVNYIGTLPHFPECRSCKAVLRILHIFVCIQIRIRIRTSD
jgi:hypothetical protein